jgi:hypothetical protein
MNEKPETFNATPAFSLFPVGEELALRACKVEQTIAQKLAEILEA